MIKRYRAWRAHRRLLGRPPIQQILLLVGAKIDNPEVLEKLSAEKVGEEVFLEVQRIFRDWIEAGIGVTREDWFRWGRYAGGQHLQRWWIHAQTRVEDLRVAKMAKLIHDTLAGSGKAEVMVLEELPPEQQDVLLRRLIAREADGRAGPN